MGSASQEAIFERVGERVVPTPLATGPWDRSSLHGGAPAALLAGLAERHDRPAEGASATGMVVSRLTAEMLRPVPRAPLLPRLRVLRGGRRVQLVEAALLDGDDREVCRMVVLRQRVRPERLPAPGHRDDAIAGPDAGAPLDDAWDWPAFHSDGMEIRFVRGGWLTGEPACTAWFRLRVPVVAGETTTPLQRVAAAADFGNGVSAALPMGEWLFINPDLTVHLTRPATGEWVALDARTYLSPETGTALAESALWDERGRVGRSAQSLLVEPR